MIIQRVIKGISDLDRTNVRKIFKQGILCNWWRNEGSIPAHEIRERLNQRHLDWHQNRYGSPAPDYGNEPFHKHTPFISTTAGTAEQDAQRTFQLFPAFRTALKFATNRWKEDGYLFYCYVFVLGKKSVELEQFSEELRDLHVHTRWSPFHPEGEITAKIRIPPQQIEGCEYYNIDEVNESYRNQNRPTPTSTISNPHYEPAEQYQNIRGPLHDTDFRHA